MESALLLVAIVEIFLFARIIIRQNRELSSKLEEREAAPVRQVRSPNKLEKLDPNVTYFDENNPMNIPKDVKFEVEGGDGINPYYSN